MARYQRIKTRAFTLVELLTVVAVVAVLLSILLPAAAKLREPARRTMCADNMRQLMAAVLSYANDNSGKGPMRGWWTYSVAEPTKEALGRSTPGSPELDLQGTLGSYGKVLVNLGQLYRKWIGGQHDRLYCPSAYMYRDMTWTPGSQGFGGWKSAFVSRSDCYWSLGGYNYGIPLANRSTTGTPQSPLILGGNPFPPSVWSGAFSTWVANWESQHPGESFQMPSSPVLATDLYIGGFSPPHRFGLNAMYTDGHVRFHQETFTTTSGNLAQYDVWYKISSKQ
jgi:prepilin-type N-terminal cleavage/methylation domain-containing protein/prepilin-type processing-associated H-X9-DG protein